MNCVRHAMGQSLRVRPGRQRLALGLLLCSVIHTAQAGFFEDLSKKAKEVGDSVGEASESIKESVGLGATTDEDGVKQDNVLGSVLEGASVCGGVAAILGKGGNTTAKAAAACGAANGVVTALANSGRKEYAEKYQAITEDMAASEADINRLHDEAEANDRQALVSRQQLDELVKQAEDDEEFISKADQMRNELDTSIREARRSKSIAQDKIHIIEGQIAELDEIIENSPDVKEIETTRIALVDQQKKLLEAVESSNNVEQELVAQKEKLDEEILEHA